MTTEQKDLIYEEKISIDY